MDSWKYLYFDNISQHEESEKEVKKLVNFLRTKAKPHIYYMPKIMNETLTAKLEDSKTAVQGTGLKIHLCICLKMNCFENI